MKGVTKMHDSFMNMSSFPTEHAFLWPLKTGPLEMLLKVR